MAQFIRQGNIFGRIGSGLAQGLAEQVPKEMENSRLRTGLKALADQADQGNLSPAQFWAGAAGTYGATPQMVESAQKLAMMQNKQNAYRNASGDQGYPRSSPDLRPGQENKVLDQIANSSNEMQQNQGMPMQPGVHHGQKTPGVKPGQNIPEIATKNPLDPAAAPRLPWTRQQKLDRHNYYRSKGFLDDMSEKLTAEDEATDLAESGALQKRNDYFEEQSQKARDEFQRQLELKLQKKGDEVFADLPGEYKANMERGIERDLRENPKLSYKDAAEDWSNRALALAKTKGKVEKMARTTGIESFGKGDENLKKLESYSGIFKKAGNSEEYFNILQRSPEPATAATKDNPGTLEKAGFNLSPQGAAMIAFPPNKNMSNYVKSFKPTSAFFQLRKDESIPDQIKSSARKAAIDIGKVLDDDQSLLTAARMLSEKDSNFDQQAFFDQLNEDVESGKIRTNSRQRDEIAEGKRDILPHWGDILIFPWFRRSTR